MCRRHTAAGHERDGGLVDLVVAEFDELHAHLAREGPDELPLGDEPEFDEGATEGLAIALLLVDGVHQLFFGDHSVLKEDRPQLLHVGSFARIARARRSPRSCRVPLGESNTR